jgi:predicted acyl esterase
MDFMITCAFIPKKKLRKIDEASDTYDTIDWLVKNTPNNNGNVGWELLSRILLDLFLISNHPALKVRHKRVLVIFL